MNKNISVSRIRSSGTEKKYADFYNRINIENILSLSNLWCKCVFLYKKEYWNTCHRYIFNANRINIWHLFKSNVFSDEQKWCVSKEHWWKQKNVSPLLDTYENLLFCYKGSNCPSWRLLTTIFLRFNILFFFQTINVMNMNWEDNFEITWNKYMLEWMIELDSVTPVEPFLPCFLLIVTDILRVIEYLTKNYVIYARINYNIDRNQ